MAETGTDSNTSEAISANISNLENILVRLGYMSESQANGEIDRDFLKAQSGLLHDFRNIIKDPGSSNYTPELGERLKASARELRDDNAPANETVFGNRSRFGVMQSWAEGELNWGQRTLASSRMEGFTDELKANMPAVVAFIKDADIYFGHMDAIHAYQVAQNQDYEAEAAAVASIVEQEAAEQEAARAEQETQPEMSTEDLTVEQAVTNVEQVLQMVHESFDGMAPGEVGGEFDSESNAALQGLLTMLNRDILGITEQDVGGPLGIYSDKMGQVIRARIPSHEQKDTVNDMLKEQGGAKGFLASLDLMLDRGMISQEVDPNATAPEIQVPGWLSGIMSGLIGFVTVLENMLDIDIRTHLDGFVRTCTGLIPGVPEVGLNTIMGYAVVPEVQPEGTQHAQNQGTDSDAEPTADEAAEEPAQEVVADASGFLRQTPINPTFIQAYPSDQTAQPDMSAEELFVGPPEPPPSMQLYLDNAVMQQLEKAYDVQNGELADRGRSYVFDQSNFEITRHEPLLVKLPGEDGKTIYAIAGRDIQTGDFEVHEVNPNDRSIWAIAEEAQLARPLTTNRPEDWIKARYDQASMIEQLPESLEEAGQTGALFAFENYGTQYANNNLAALLRDVRDNAVDLSDITASARRASDRQAIITSFHSAAGRPAPTLDQKFETRVAATKFEVDKSDPNWAEHLRRQVEDIRDGVRTTRENSPALYDDFVDTAKDGTEFYVIENGVLQRREEQVAAFTDNAEDMGVIAASIEPEVDRDLERDVAAKIGGPGMGMGTAA